MSVALEQCDPGDWDCLKRNTDVIAANLRGALPQARVFNSANLVVNTGVTTALAFDSEVYDQGNLHSTAVNTSRLTAKITGLYDIVGYAIYAPSGAGLRITNIRFNGVANLAGDERGNNGAGDAVIVTVPAQFRLAAGDYVELTVFQNTGAALNVLAGSILMMHRVGGYTNEGVA